MPLPITTMTELEECEIMLRSIEDTMLRTYYGEEHTKLLDIANKLNKKIKQLRMRNLIDTSFII
jgi:hypothetical protein